MLRKIEIGMDLGVILIILINLFFPQKGTAGALNVVGNLVIVLGLIASQVALRQDKKLVTGKINSWRILTIFLLGSAILLSVIARSTF
ncbi:hypothetical protein [Pediococcus pentosaceus]|uniref:hypothetical protein n=1 Tax=Pediococcus pentosaceus TaxID=1255 RepID=UPI0039825FB0